MTFFNYEADPNVFFDMYTSMHLLMLGIVVVLFVLFFLFKSKLATSKYEKQIRYGIGGFLIVMLITLITVDASGGKLYLPFHLCSISYLLMIVLLFTDNKTVFRYLFFTGIIGGIVTFAIPELDHAGYNRFRFYEFIIAHTMIIIVPIYYLTNRGYTITMKHTIWSIVVTNIIALFMIPINLFLRSSEIVADANFMFVLGAPEDVEAVFGQPPWHLFTFEGVLLVTFFGLYAVARWYQNKQKAV